MSAAPSVDSFVGDERPRGAETEAREFDAEAVAGVRAYLEAVREYLAELHRGGATGRMVNEENSDAIDRLIRRLVRRAEAAYYARGGEPGARVSIAAVGGYARREMSICSDVDLLFLHGRELQPLAAELAERLQYWLWDAGVKVGGAVRNIADTIELASADDTVGTAVLDTRFLGGDPELFQDLVKTIRTQLLADPHAFILRQQKAVAERHAKFGDSLYLLQPNLKEGAGGLRDYHAAYWASRATIASIRGVNDLLHVGLLSESEMEEYHAALDFLWRTRNELHLLMGRNSDQLSFEQQDHLARTFGFGDGGIDLPVERFMGTYYRHARAIQSLSEGILDQCLARARRGGERPARRAVEDGFGIEDGQLEIPHASHLRERPLRLLTVFAVAQRHQVPLSRTARRRVRESLDLIDEEFQRDPDAAAVFLDILESEHRVMRTLMSMNDVGLLGRYLPEWEHIVCRWQHVIYHTYTVDVHSIFLVEELRRLWRGKYEALPDLTELMRTAPDRAALFLGCLLHDVGKGLGGDHSAQGESRARACLERLGLDAERIDRVAFLVRYHLLMSAVAQRRDLADPKVIVEFARAVGDRENLRNLYLLTFADIRASSRAAWTDWKGQLLQELYERSSEFLETGGDDPRRALEQIEARIEVRREAARQELQELGVGEERIEDFFSVMPRRYFIAHLPRQIARHAVVLESFESDRVLAMAVREMRGGFSEFIVWTPDAHGLYAKIAGSLTAKGINILGSHVYTTRSGMALEVYRVTTPRGGDEEKRLVWDEFEAFLTDVLSGRRSPEELLRGRPRRLGTTALPSRTPPSVTVSNDASDFYTVVDVAADDRLGLLFDLVRTLTDHGLEIYISKAATILDQVADTFYVKDARGRKLVDPDAISRLEADLLEAAARGVADG